MIVGVPSEIKEGEYRVAITPVGVEELAKRGHQVLIQKGAGVGSGIPDEEYQRAGGKIAPKAADIFEKADLLLKVKEPLPAEFEALREGQVLFTYFHFAANKDLTLAMQKRKIVALAYETVEDGEGRLPLLIPMSEVAGRMAIQEGAKCLERPMFGRGILLAGVPGVAAANVVVLGGGVVGTNAAKIAAGLRAKVTVLDIKMDRLRHLDDVMPQNVFTLFSNSHNIKAKIVEADLLVGAVLLHGARTPVLISKKMLALMKPGSVVVDASIDQGGCLETSKPTTHANPTYIVDGVVHYCVANMPAAVAGTSTYALTNVTLAYVLAMADHGVRGALEADPAFARGLNMAHGQICLKTIADQYGLPYIPLRDALRAIPE